ncbi:MAG TPA: hypothetical protein VI874_01440, partial [Candidatus Norongarragalinales archaeon]|nr:hypothetical protein [Candidatus Norongarragalinales archaeon]
SRVDDDGVLTKKVSNCDQRSARRAAGAAGVAGRVKVHFGLQAHLKIILNLFDFPLLVFFQFH